MPEKETIIIQQGALKAIYAEKIFPLDALMCAAYGFTRDYYAAFGRPRAGHVSLELQPKRKRAAAALKADAARLAREVDNELLRMKLNARGDAMREKCFREAMTSPPAPAAQPAQTEESARRAELLELDEELKKIIEQARTMKFSDDPLGINVKTKEKKGARKPDR